MGEECCVDVVFGGFLVDCFGIVFVEFYLVVFW